MLVRYALSLHLGLMLLGGSAVAASLQVDATLGADVAGCGSSGGAGACKTINYTVNSRAAAGDTVQVAAGTYSEQVSIPPALTGLTLAGAQAGVDARTRAASESILDGTVGGLTTGITVAADNVTIDGFTIRNYNAGGASFGYGIIQYGSVSGARVVNNILRGNGYTGLYMGCAGASQCLAQHNLFDGNQAAGGGGDGIYSDSGTVNVLIDSNKFTNQINGSVIITGVASTTQSNITISNNVSLNDGLIGIFGASNVTITNNTATNPVAGIRIDGSQNVSVTGNAILGGANTAFYAFRASDNNGFPLPDDHITVTRNTFVASHYGVLVTNNFSNPTDPAQANGVLANAASLTLRCNRIVGNSAGGLLNGDINAPNITATQNWWGCNAGPNAAGCDTASGANANNPWLTLTLSATPNPLTLGASTTLNASLNTDSSGATAACSLPDITPIAFAGMAGTISGAASNTSNGSAGATYTPANAGVSSVSTTVDNQTVSLDITANTQADLSASVTLPASAVAGSTVTGSYTCSNAGPNDATDASCTITGLPVGATFACVPASSAATLASGSSLACSVSYTAPASGSVIATVTAASSTADPNSANNTASATTAISASADLAASATLPASAVAGSTVNGSYACINNGPSSASNVTCTIAGLPVGASTACVPASSAATLASGSSLACTVSYTAPASGSVIATVTAASSTADPNSANNTASATTAISASADLAASASLPASAVAGSTVTGSYACINNGPSSASNVTCAIAGLPVGASTACVPASSAATLAAGSTLSCTVSFTAPASGSVSLVVTASSATSDPVASNNTAAATTRSIAPPVAAPTLSPLALLLSIALTALVGARLQRRRN